MNFQSTEKVVLWRGSYQMEVAVVQSACRTVSSTGIFRDADVYPVALQDRLTPQQFKEGVQALSECGASIFNRNYYTIVSLITLVQWIVTLSLIPFSSKTFFLIIMLVSISVSSVLTIYLTFSYLYRQNKWPSLSAPLIESFNKMDNSKGVYQQSRFEINFRQYLPAFEITVYGTLAEQRQAPMQYAPNRLQQNDLATPAVAPMWGHQQ